ncbi:MAG TPA: glycoside hydrolase family 27 protein, partial [Draconibacterium sp.]|nr:glycoside hydrolase family 27 protein [Draconibacterium sp.]
GSYDFLIEAKNKYGAVSREFKIVVGDKIALTPPTGWNSWGGHMVTVSDKTMRNAADIMVEKGLADVGFQYIGIDDCWMRVNKEMYDERPESVLIKHAGYDYVVNGILGDVRDAEGNILPNGKFPDMKAMTDYIHEKGLKAGIYSTPGKVTCQRWCGSYGHERADADRYAKWGFDLLKYDLCTGAKPFADLKSMVPGFDHKDFWKPMADYLLVQDHDILFNLCQYGIDYPWTWAPTIGIQTWRTGGDLNHNVKEYFDEALRITGELRKYSKPGQWSDPDFMYIHRIKDVLKMNEPSLEIPLNTNQRYQYVTLWSVICAPFFFSCDINEIDEFTVRLLANADVFNINQDELGYVAKVVRNKDDETIMVKEMSDGTKILAVFNRNANNEKIINFKWSEIKDSGAMQVYDVWRHKNAGIFKDDIAVKLSPDGVGLFKLTKEE